MKIINNLLMIGVYVYIIYKLDLLKVWKLSFLITIVINAGLIIFFKNSLSCYITLILIVCGLFLMISTILKKKIPSFLLNMIYLSLFSSLCLFYYSSIMALIGVIYGYSLNEAYSVINSSYVSILVRLSLLIIVIIYVGKDSTKDLINRMKQFSESNSNMIIYLLLMWIAMCFLIYCLLFNYEIKTLIIIVFLYFILFVSYKSVIYILDVYSSNEKFHNSLSSIEIYENMVDKYRIENHESKNRLQTIRTMIKQKDNMVEKYIDDLLDNVYYENERLVMDLSILPNGVRATLYNKIATIENNHIKLECNIDRKIGYDAFSEKLYAKVCDILNVLIDNAINEVYKKDGFIKIDIYPQDNNILFLISNSLFHHINKNEIFDEGYSTKGEGHGYGLSYVKKIIDNSDELSLDTSIRDDVIIQTLKVKK